MKEICWLNLKSMMVINQVTYSIYINRASWLRCTYSITIMYYNEREKKREKENKKRKKNVVNKITRCRNKFFFLGQTGSNHFFPWWLCVELQCLPFDRLPANSDFLPETSLIKKMLISGKFLPTSTNVPNRHIIHIKQRNKRGKKTSK